MKTDQPWLRTFTKILARDLHLLVLRRLLPLVLLLAACASTPLERFEQTLAITASGTQAADDGLYAFAKVRADEISRTAPSLAVGEAMLTALERDVTAARALLMGVKALLVTGMAVAKAVKAGGAVALITSWLPTLTTAIGEANKALALVGVPTLVLP